MIPIQTKPLTDTNADERRVRGVKNATLLCECFIKGNDGERNAEFTNFTAFYNFQIFFTRVELKENFSAGGFQCRNKSGSARATRTDLVKRLNASI